MWFQHDPANLSVAAVALGRLVGSGAMSGGAAREAVALMAREGVRPGMDVSGLRCRMAWAMRDTAQAVRLARANADAAVRWAVRPLFRQLAPAAAIEEAAGRAAGEVLEWHEVAEILGQELAASRGRRRA